ncbi:hypothetical protein ABNM12_01230 [Pseudomonas syringae]|uniref:hypothetical protein n=1 Tax=Pseudomonas TaxID=286 RepID=UPI0009AF2329|nr:MULTISPECIES: hypothetical protein [Pseudomonas syringae group]MCH5533651.1 hypothetical protein [Pseudomonas syringae pv. syringae]MCH5547767.1 hypothetical protein [Pseudomonas syringae pv. syringae]MCH5553710.1 hypothetical protein [Pseudomonas syringae pv. syringae]MCH5573719.1 hypothetical protein [Pseudomonas syringae pv. syringae]MCH5666091.1 hypothetical protein [Pseudomonas syringae pv. syringae]
MKSLVVTTAAVIGLQGMAFAAAAKQAISTVDGSYAAVQDAGKNVSSESKAAPLQVALRRSGGLRINTACDDGLPCPPRG